MVSKGLCSGRGCPCKALAHQLDRRGPAWCHTHVDEIVTQLSQHIGSYDWRKKVLAGVKALPLVAAGQLNPARPRDRWCCWRLSGWKLAVDESS